MPEGRIQTKWSDMVPLTGMIDFIRERKPCYESDTELMALSFYNILFAAGAAYAMLYVAERLMH